MITALIMILLMACLMSFVVVYLTIGVVVGLFLQFVKPVYRGQQPPWWRVDFLELLGDIFIWPVRIREVVRRISYRIRQMNMIRRTHG